MTNIDQKTVEGFGQKWKRFDQLDLPKQDAEERFSRYFSIFPFSKLARDAVGFDLGCGSGRWARIMSTHVSVLHCIDASENALGAAI